jgi:hypothetical protein
MYLGLITVVLTIVQPKDPEVDKMFRMGAIVVIVVCIGLRWGLKVIEQKIEK